MNFDFSDEQKFLQKTTREFLEDRSPLTSCRQALESGLGWDHELWKGAAEMGWLGTAIPDRFGGAGLGYLELAVIAEELGRALAPIPFGSSVYLATEAILRGGTEEQRERYLPRLAAGELIGTLALVERPGHPAPSDITTVFKQGRVTGTKIAVLDGTVANFAVVGAQANGSPALVLVDLNGPGVERRKVDSIDPTHSSASLVLTDAPAEPLQGGWDLLERILDGAAVLLAFEQVGGAGRALELTKSFTMDRYAFGRPIASFQALKHRLVDVYVAIELARSNCLWEHGRSERSRARSGSPLPARESARRVRSSWRRSRWCRCTGASALRGSTTATYSTVARSTTPSYSARRITGERSWCGV